MTSDIAHHLLDGVDPGILVTAETVATQVPGVKHAHTRARWTGRTLRVEVEGFVDPDTTRAARSLMASRSRRVRGARAQYEASVLPKMTDRVARVLGLFSHPNRTTSEVVPP